MRNEMTKTRQMKNANKCNARLELLEGLVRIEAEIKGRGSSDIAE